MNPEPIVARGDGIVLVAGSRLPPAVSQRVHEAVAVLRAKKAAIEAGVPARELSRYEWALRRAQDNSTAA